MSSHPLLFTIFLIFTGAAIVATIAMFARQALIVAYILLGVLLGPSLLGWVNDASILKGVADVGIMFLLFLLGLNLHPQKLIQLVRQTTVVTGLSSLLFAVIGFGLGLLFGFNPTESAIIGATLMFSSTIIGLKLLPTTVLHHQHTGEIMISILLLQDMIAIVVLIALHATVGQGTLVTNLGILALGLVGLSVFAYVVNRFILIPMIARFDTIQEYIFLLAIGWCLGIAELGALAGLSHEIGAFIAGIAIATNRISFFIAESLKPLRDFFLIIFFFAVGASIDLNDLTSLWFPAIVIAAVIMLVKPVMFRWLLGKSGEKPARAAEIGVRLGQGSEFSLLIAVAAAEIGIIGPQASFLIQLTALVTFIASSYWIVLRYPTPIAVNPELHRN